MINKFIIVFYSIYVYNVPMADFMEELLKRGGNHDWLQQKQKQQK